MQPPSLPRLMPATRVFLILHGLAFLLGMVEPAILTDFVLWPSGVFFETGAAAVETTPDKEPPKGSDLFQVWQPLTYWIFVYDFFSMLFLAVVLWLFMSHIERELGTRRFVQLYLGVAILSGLANTLLNPGMTVMLGPYAATIAGLVVLLYFRPNDVILAFFFIPMKVKWFALILIGILTLSSLQSGFESIGLPIAGIILGFLFCMTFYPERNQLWGSGSSRSRSRFDPYTRPDDSTFRPRRRDRDEEEAEVTEVVDKTEWEQKKLDELLEKISRKGIDSLTREEKDLLDRLSKKQRKD